MGFSNTYPSDIIPPPIQHICENYDSCREGGKGGLARRNTIASYLLRCHAAEESHTERVIMKRIWVFGIATLSVIIFGCESTSPNGPVATQVCMGAVRHAVDTIAYDHTDGLHVTVVRTDSTPCVNDSYGSSRSYVGTRTHYYRAYVRADWGLQHAFFGDVSVNVGNTRYVFNLLNYSPGSEFIELIVSQPSTQHTEVSVNLAGVKTSYLYTGNLTRDFEHLTDEGSIWKIEAQRYFSHYPNRTPSDLMPMGRWQTSGNVPYYVLPQRYLAHGDEAPRILKLGDTILVVPGHTIDSNSISIHITRVDQPPIRMAHQPRYLKGAIHYDVSIKQYEGNSVVRGAKTYVLARRANNLSTILTAVNPVAVLRFERDIRYNDGGLQLEIGGIGSSSPAMPVEMYFLSSFKRDEN